LFKSLYCNEKNSAFLITETNKLFIFVVPVFPVGLGFADLGYPPGTVSPVKTGKLNDVVITQHPPLSALFFDFVHTCFFSYFLGMPWICQGFALGLVDSDSDNPAAHFWQSAGMPRACTRAALTWAGENFGIKFRPDSVVCLLRSVHGLKPDIDRYKLAPRNRQSLYVAYHLCTSIVPT
jgi:hypothetical protein